MIAESDDLKLIVNLPSPVPSAFSERWRYVVATALVNPEHEDEWMFLRRCAINEFNDRWVDAGAIQSLKLTASPRSRAMLEEALGKSQAQASRIAEALAYTKVNGAPLESADLSALAERVAQVLKIGIWDGNGAPRFNEAGDKALVDLKFHSSLDLLIYTATFHKIDVTWKLRGVHETYQAFAPSAPIRRK